MNFFNWIRQGVRRAVVFGVSDAVGDIGTPPEGDDIGQRLLEVLRKGGPEVPPQNRLPIEPKRKKLGRTLNQIQAGVERAP